MRPEAGAPELPGFLDCLARGGRACFERPVAAFGGFATLTAAILGGCVVPWFNFLFLLLVLAPLFGGYAHLILALLDRRPVTLRILFKGFRQYERFLSLFWLGYLMSIFLCFPFLISLWLDRHFSWNRALVFGAGAGLSVLLLTGILHRYLFVFFIAAERPPETTVDNILRFSDGLISAHRRHVLSVGLQLVLLGGCAILPVVMLSNVHVLAGVPEIGRLAWLGWSICFLTWPVTACGLGNLYRSLERSTKRSFE